MEPVPVDPLKGTFDRMLAAAGLILTSPLWGMIALAIWLGGRWWPEDDGPVLYYEPRVSAGELFRLPKFRTMRVADIERVHQDGLTVKYLERAGQGYTHVGRWLVRWYLDELPQLIPILRGEMSFVGPRPPAPFEYEREVAEGNLRKRLARAGLVGLQQAYKGRTRGFEEEIALDHAYVDRVRELSPWRRLGYDVSLLFRAIRVLLEGKGL